ncbi:hypothetical protein, partial [Lactiplantibacillus plantarum]
QICPKIRIKFAIYQLKGINLMSFFNDFHILPGTHTSSYTSSVSNDIFGGLHSFILNVIAAFKG